MYHYVYYFQSAGMCNFFNVCVIFLVSECDSMCNFFSVCMCNFFFSVTIKAWRENGSSGRPWPSATVTCWTTRLTAMSPSAWGIPRKWCELTSTCWEVGAQCSMPCCTEHWPREERFTSQTWNHIHLTVFLGNSINDL